MKLGRVLAISALFLILSSFAAFAEEAGQWDSTVNSCRCHILLTFERANGSVSGTITFPGRKKKIYDILVKGGSILFHVDQPNSNAFVTYLYEVTVSGDGNNMTGKYTKQGDPSETGVFVARRRNPLN